MTLSPDVVNGLFELFGSWFTWSNFNALRKEKKISGVYWPSTLFFSAWGVWNAFGYYPALGQWFSFAGAVLLFSGNFAWLILLVKIKWNAKKSVETKTSNPSVITLNEEQWEELHEKLNSPVVRSEAFQKMMRAENVFKKSDQGETSLEQK